MDVRECYLAAAAAFAELVERIGDLDRDGPALGVWSLRDLLGHTVSGGLQQVLHALDRPADAAVISSPEGYFALARTVDPAVYAAAVAASTEDARRAGAALGPRPAGPVRSLVETVGDRLPAVHPATVVTTAVGGMAIDTWLPTRTFELAVHSLDAAAAAGVPVSLPPPVVAEAAVLAARIAGAVGDGPAVLRALTGRAVLPAGFSVV